MGNAAVSWANSKQKSVPLSSTEAELMGLCHGEKDHFCTELGITTESMHIYNDNQCCIFICRNGGFHKKSKHIDIQQDG
ncbi:hypothetical protein O6H91_02G061200 [Diphasiastrum complanatum]|uniref:Uncharacterized protein n=1 Tax=Diphasiastrum complanatum TaxID=34168 RepID=A0ACC2EG18_DIPCM|nr:hypothetical protein O6H91_02G061200 [Diphasiastrum complanatum]